MKKLLPIKPVVIFLLFMCLTEYSKAQLKIGAIIRPRTEFRNGYKTLRKPTSDATFFTEQRTRIDLAYSAQKFRIGVAIQDVRIWGTTPQLSKADGLTSLYQGWGEMFITKKFSIKLGRQEFIYDDERILGGLDWASQGRSHDAIKLVYSDSTWALHLGAAYNQDNNTPEPKKLFGTYYDASISNYKTMQFLWFSKDLNKFKFSALALNNGLQGADSSMNYMQLYGLNLNYKPSRFQVNGSFYYEGGKDKVKKTVDAFLASAVATYSLNKAAFALGGDYVSGTGKNQTADHSFDPLYGTHHKFYGYMDYFYVGNASAQTGKTVGLVDLYLKTTFKPVKGLIAMLDVHQFSSPVKIYNPKDATQTLNSSLGTEIDFTLNYSFAPEMNILAGYSQMFATKAMEAIKGGDRTKLTNWSYIMFIFRPKLL